jgi:sulfatase modifying factor 1
MPTKNSYAAAVAAAIAAVVFSAVFQPASARAVTIDLVPVGNPGNANDPDTGIGRVTYDYQIGKYEVTIGQYAAFLNAVAKTDTYGLYDSGMASDLNLAGISRSGAPGTYSYSAIAASGSAPYGGVSAANRPIGYVSWFNAARFANWLANGQPTGAQTSTTTENGAYNVNGATSGNAQARNVTNPNTGAAPTYFIPTQNEWYKAAYYSPVLNSGSGGYYTYATQSNVLPGNVPGSGANQANFQNESGSWSVTQSVDYSLSQNYLTDVGAFTNSASFYGTFDQSGNLWEWNDLTGTASPLRGYNGGAWVDVARQKGDSSTAPPDSFGNNIGFRLVAPVPEPSTYAMALAGLACGGFSLFRRRRAR